MSAADKRTRLQLLDAKVYILTAILACEPDGAPVSPTLLKLIAEAFSEADALGVPRGQA